MYWLNLWELMLELAPWLFAGTAVASLLHIWLPKNFISSRLGAGGMGEVTRAVALGVPLPLCSCGVIPAAMSLKKEGASDGASIGFMISTPQTGLDSILVTGSILGWPFAVFKVFAALMTGLVGGFLVEKTNVSISSHQHRLSGNLWREAFQYGIDELIYPIWRWLTIGMLISAAVTTWIPHDQFSTFAGGGIWTLLIMVGISMPLYVCATASVPVAASLVAAGFPEGAALVFLMAGPATNVATIGAVHRVFGNRVMAVYLLTVFIGSIGFGLIFDMFWGLNTTGAVMVHRHDSWFLTVSAGLLTLLLGWFGVQDIRQRLRRPSQGQQSVELKVDGMTCGGCVKRLTTKLETVTGVEVVEVTLEPGKAAVYGADLNRDLLKNAIREAGFSV